MAEQQRDKLLPKDERLWTVSDVATFLQVGVQQVYALMAQGELPVTKVPKKNQRFEPAVIREWVKRWRTWDEDGKKANTGRAGGN